MDTLCITTEFWGLVLLPVLALALLYDLRYHRIPNWLNFAALLAGLGLHAVAQGLGGLLNSAAGAMVGLLLLLPFYGKGVMGAGDVKLMAAVGSLVGMPMALWSVAATLIAGGAIGVVMFAWHRGLWDLLARYGQMAKLLVSTGQVEYQSPAPGSIGTKKFPYSTAIAAGTVTVLIATGQLWASGVGVQLPFAAGVCF